MSEREANAYDGVRQRVTELLAEFPAAVVDRPVPATPEWDVRGVLSHLVGVTDDVVNGRLEGVASDAWTAAQVDARRNSSVADLLAEWDDRAAAFATMLIAAPPEVGGQAVFDGATHEHDLRHALGRPGAREADAVAVGWEWVVGARTRLAGPAIRLVTEHGDDTVGAGECRVTVRAPRFELFRATCGRRSVSEIESYAWEPDAQPLLLLGGPIFRLRDVPLAE